MSNSNTGASPEPGKTREIRGVMENLFAKIHTPYTVIPYSQNFHNTCYETAIERGYPMEADCSIPSLLPYLKPGVIMGSLAFGHIEDEDRRVYACFYTAFFFYVDDANIECITVFIERFIRQQKQLDPVLDSLASFLLTTPDHFEPVAANFVLTGMLNMINTTALEFQTQGTKVSIYAKGYPGFMRQMSCAGEAFALMAFPRSIPVQSYIQCLAEGAIFLGLTNDVLSFYKEELAGETVNHISIFAGCHGISKMMALEKVIDDVTKADAQVCAILSEIDQDVYEAWQKFKVGYVDFHMSCKRYRLDDLMNHACTL